jgi:aromatic-L-amino-acid decarboxylase
VLVRDGEVLRRAHAVDAGYLPTLPDGVYSPSQYGPELSRPYRGLRVWLPLKVFGSAKFEAALLEKRQLAVEACNQVAAIEGIDIVAPPDLSLFAFTLGWPGSSLEEQNGATRQLMEGVTARGRVMITGAQVGERFLGRVCVLCFRTRREHVQQCVEDLRLEAARIRAEHGH